MKLPTNWRLANKSEEETAFLIFEASVRKFIEDNGLTIKQSI